MASATQERLTELHGRTNPASLAEMNRLLDDILSERARDRIIELARERERWWRAEETGLAKYYRRQA